eukprot:CAMPEP_0172496766 /NCGR_PEP_ID=MMETSP1066-20121228/92627_1 /TAXON_ID=671091 /ORGANISM="Coscinodiscus wailesii, Strain CCMP2513" /LENGTH=693 /DNA_ID=CAMNT_0013269221 /DNA_START=388 /DNA_END=2469 /DNA_ORIENTATION=-
MSSMESLEQLAEKMSVDVPKMVILLKKQRKKLEDGEEKAKLIDELLKSSGEYDTAPQKKKKKRKSLEEEKKEEVPRDDDDNDDIKTTTTPPQTLEKQTKKKKKKKSTKKQSTTTPENTSDTETITTPTTTTTTTRGIIRPQRPTSLEKTRAAQTIAAQTRRDESLKDPTLLTSDRFATRTDLHPASKRAVTEILGHDSMTEIQSGTFAAASAGRDVLGRARTGTGKTLAFLLPAIEVLVREREESGGTGGSVGVLVVSPTRELATQIGDQAGALLTYHSRLSVRTIYGGFKMGADVAKFNRQIPSVLVATPGRLLDHLQSTTLSSGRKFSDVLRETSVLVLDETDRLLDMGFRKDIMSIMSYLPRKRQTLLFSATIPKDLKGVMAQVMKPDFVTVDCINDGDVTSETNARVNQSHVVLSDVDQLVSHVPDVVAAAMAEEEDYKIVAFFPVARVVGYYAALFNDGLGIPVIEIHSRKSQSARNTASERFRNAKRGILFTSDVSARGVDYPDVTHVLQFGMPESKEQYIHRLGRTGRAGKPGEGWLILAPFETNFLTELKGQQIPLNTQLQSTLDTTSSSSATTSAGEKFEKLMHRIENGDTTFQIPSELAYKAFLGYYLGQMKRMRMRSKEELVSIANHYSSLMGLTYVPKLEKKTVGKMNLRGVEGIVIADKTDFTGPERNQGRGNNRYRGRR